MDEQTYKCRKCGETIAEVSGQKVRFCPFCGAPLPEREKSAAPDQKTLSELLKAERYGEIIQLTEGSGDTVARAYELAARLAELTRNYTIEVARLSQSVSYGKKLLAAIFGDDSFQNSPVHTDYFNNMGESVKQLAETLRTIPDGETAGEIAYNAVMILLGEKSLKTCGDSYWMQVAVEQHAAPFLDFLNKEQLKTLVGYYSPMARGAKGLPVQKQLLKAMEKKLKT